VKIKGEMTREKEIQNKLKHELKRKKINPDNIDE